MSKRLQSGELYDFGGFCLDVNERALTKDGQIVPLTPKAFDTLIVLVRNGGHVVDKDQLLKEVWPDTFVEEGVLAVNVAAIRKALSDGEEGRSYIETVPRRGYRFIGQVQAIRKPAEDGAVEEKRQRRKQSWTTPWGLAAGLLAIVLAGFGWFFSRPRPSSIPPPSQPIPLTSYPGTELSPTFSPDGSQVAFSWDGERQDNFDIYVKVIDRDNAHRLTDNPARDVSPAWSPDGRTIAFAREGAVFLVPPTGGSETKVTDVQAKDRAGIAWTRDSKSLVVSSGNRKPRLTMLSVDTRNMKELTKPFGEGNDYGDVAPAVSPDGLKLVFVRYIATVGADIYLMPLAGGELRRLTQDDSQTCGGIIWTANGHEVVYSSRGSLWRRSLEAQIESPSKRVEGVDPAGVLQLAISRPDSASLPRLAYSRVVFDTNIWVRETTASSLPATKLVASTRPDTNPQFSPDGRRLVFTSERSGSSQIWVANKDGSNPLQLTWLAGSFINAPRWSPDGRTIVFTSAQNKNQDIYSVPADGAPFNA